MTAKTPTAVILIAHGSRRAEANADVCELARQLQATGDHSHVTVAYLELAAPSIPDAARDCVTRGAAHVLLMPWFLSAGTHVVDDLRRFVEELSAEHLGVTFELCPPLGVHPLMLDIVRARLRERLASPGRTDGA